MYKYPDHNDKNLSKNVINKDWEDFGLEDKYIAEAINKSQKNCRDHLLDAGCGHGRLIPFFEKIFKTIIAIDPDHDRLTVAQKKFSSRTNIEFFNTFIQDFYFNHSFDFVVCSHVIQHISTEEVFLVLKKLHSLLKTNGHLMLSTTNWPDDTDQFEIRNTINNSFKIVSDQEFNACAKNCDQHLPTRHFSEKTLLKILETSNFNIVFSKKYHGFPKVRGDNFILAKKMG